MVLSVGITVVNGPVKADLGPRTLNLKVEPNPIKNLTGRIEPKPMNIYSYAYNHADS